MYFLTDINDPLKWTDYSQAIDYYGELEQDCDDDCMDQGSRWSIIYQLCFATCCLMTLDALFLCLGAFLFHCRALGGFCAFLLSCANIAAIVTTGVFRFNTMGKLAALSTQSTKY